MTSLKHWYGFYISSREECPTTLYFREILPCMYLLTRNDFLAYMDSFLPITHLSCLTDKILIALSVVTVHGTGLYQEIALSEYLLEEQIHVNTNIIKTPQVYLAEFYKNNSAFSEYSGSQGGMVLDKT